MPLKSKLHCELKEKDSLFKWNLLENVVSILWGKALWTSQRVSQEMLWKLVFLNHSDNWIPSFRSHTGSVSESYCDRMVTDTSCEDDELIWKWKGHQSQFLMNLLYCQAMTLYWILN